ncbi:hypothetical protein UA08_08248 [Talaromyces atroroseus]|uniref:Uncharacterized protein n=1 Tax=Talaromyces atroroseus TaxID=1441469 RepID=A0A225A926_TALAT|nr:hypothetical protein UA08_08248 [Talaromyces atroroseus]OKL56490.1 hypothetical protein UA08_08248 [Talaromyces atroroseus]
MSASKLMMDVALIHAESSVLKGDLSKSAWEVEGLGDPNDADHHSKVVVTPDGCSGGYKKGIVSDFRADVNLDVDFGLDNGAM